ncbi:Helix-loop-helix DNA-binding domain [Geosmithia morbida]|uniref:Helix-loop-helix DNA-binding domain n=1 Tax=Geosmithia morbida TaxID=1094350 RepID=A0A9P4YVU5_9HYPO|nr:Helix-loop-helix DNA-binding domain [Geosmithia morbida]KAF4122623.1 Helix-loop-helix DNA-binding domain [Geosmithia morbida]
MAQHGFTTVTPTGSGIDPNALNMGGSYNQTFASEGYGNNANNNNHSGSGPSAFATGSSLIADEDLLDGLGGDSGGHHGLGTNQDYSGLNMGFSQDAYQAHRHSSGLRMDHNGYSNTPDGEPVPSPFAASFNANYRQQMQNPSMATSLHSPMSYPEGNDQSFFNARTRMSRVSQQMQRKPSSNKNSSNNNAARRPMTPKTSAMHGLSLGSNDSPNFGGQSIQTVGSHEKSPPGQWLNTPTGSFPASYNSGFSSPMQQQAMVPPIDEVMVKGGTSMTAKFSGPNANGGSGPISSQEAKRKRRRESHNLVERRRRDNINERIQDLSKLVPLHRLEDDKIRKLIQNSTPLSPTLTGMSTPSQATSGLAGPGARRAAGAAGNITTGLPVEDKDKGPNKGDILNGAVSWTRDLMWMLHIKLQQQEELMNSLAEAGQPFPFEFTDDERRMQSELIEAMSKNDGGSFTYSRTNGSGLRVPAYTDYRGNSNSDVPPTSLDSVSITPPDNGNSAIIDDLADTNQFWQEPDDDVNGHGQLNFRDDDDYTMDLGH